MKPHKFYIWTRECSKEEFVLQQVDGYDIDGEYGVCLDEKFGMWNIVEYTTGYTVGSRNTKEKAASTYTELKDRLAKLKTKPSYQKQVEEFNEALAKLQEKQYHETT